MRPSPLSSTQGAASGNPSYSRQSADSAATVEDGQVAQNLLREGVIRSRERRRRVDFAGERIPDRDRPCGPGALIQLGMVANCEVALDAAESFVIDEEERLVPLICPPNEAPNWFCTSTGFTPVEGRKKPTALSFVLRRNSQAEP